MMEYEPFLKVSLACGGFIVEASLPTGEVTEEGEEWLTRVHVFTDDKSLKRFLLRAVTASQKDSEADKAVEKIEKELRR